MFHDTLEPEMLAPPKETWLTGPLSCSEHHVFEHRGNHILYHVPSGAFFQADGVVRDILDVCEGRSLLELLDQLRERYTEKDIMSAFKELHQAEILSFGPAEPFLPFTPPGRIEVVHLGLDITYDGFGTSFFNRENIESPAAQYMTEEVALQAIDLLMKESGRMRQCFVTFQGEEPLLNAQLVEKTIQYGEAEARKRGKEILFDVASESNLLNEQIFTILKKLNAQIVVKLTEPSEDSLPMFQSSGPYSLSSTEVLQRIQEHEADVHLRGQMDNTGPKITERIAQQLKQFPNARSVTLTFGPEATGNQASEGALSRIIENLDGLADYVRNHVLTGKSTWIGEFEDYMAQVLNRRTTYYHCGAGTRFLTVAPSGDIYVCPGLVYNERFRVGTVQGGIDRKKQKHWIKNTHVEKFEACADCWARYLCGGGCRLNSFLGSGKIEQPNPVSCELIRRSYELAMSTCLDIADADTERLQSRYMEAS